MDWIGRLRTACRVVVGGAIDGIASAFDFAGSLSCVAGGAVFALSNIVDGVLNASFYGAANTQGQLLVNLDITEFNFKLNETIPFQHVLQKNGEMNYALKDYLSPKVLNTASVVLALSGTGLKLFGANIKHWRQAKVDSQRLKEQHGIDPFRTPGCYEYALVSAESLCRSLTCSMLSCAAVSSALSYSEISRAKPCVTYPSTGNPPKDSLYYTGPVASTQIPVGLQLEKNITIEVPIIHLKILVEEQAAATAVANTTYGGGLFFKANNNPNFPVVVPALIAPCAYYAGNFFKRKLIGRRDERIAEAREEAPFSIL